MVYLQRYLVATRLVPSETAAVLVHVLCTPYTLFEATCIGCMRDLVRATAVTRGWNGYEPSQKVDHGETNVPTASAGA